MDNKDLSQYSEQELETISNTADYSDSELESIAGQSSDLRSELPELPKEEKKFPLKELASLGATGYGVKKSIDLYRRPFRERNLLAKDVMGMQEQFGVPGTKAQYLPQRLSQLEQQAKFDYNVQVNDVNYRTNQAVNVLKKRMKDFDNGILKTRLEDFTSNFEKQYPTFLKNVSDNYGKGMEGIESFLAGRGVNYNSNDFNSNVIVKSIDELTSKGVLPEELKSLSSIADSLKKDEPITLTKAKGYVSNLVKEDPFGEVSTIIRKNYGQFLEQNAPQEVRLQLKTLNQDFEKFAKLRTRIGQLRSKSGYFDTKRLTNYMLDYVTDKINTGQKEVIGLLSKGEGIISPMSGVSERMPSIEQAGQVRSTLAQAPQQANISRNLQLRKLQTELQTKVSELRMWQNKAKELVSKLKVAQGKVDKRSVLAKIPYVKNIAAKGLPLLGASTMALDAFKFAEDPTAYMGAMKSGVDYETYKRWNDVRGGKVMPTPQELDVLVKSGEIS